MLLLPFELRRREQSVLDRLRFAQRFRSARCESLAANARVRFAGVHDAAIGALALDRCEQRVLLAAGGSRLAVYRLDPSTDNAVDGVVHVRSPLQTVAAFDANAAPGVLAHRHAISSLAWFAHDAGLFVSGSYDHRVCVWDAENMQVAASFDLRSKVYAVALSPIATTHSLVACATESSHVSLCDLSSGAATHTLMGHSEELLAAAWSTRDPHQLATAGRGGCIRVWDVRRASAALFCCDDSRHAPISPPPPPPAVPAARSGGAKRRRVFRRDAPRGDAKNLSHSGAVNSLAYSRDGTFLLSSGSDNRMRLWRADNGANTLVNYPRVRNVLSHGHRIAIGSDDRCVYHPNGRQIGVYRLLSGELLGTLTGHFDAVSGCEMRTTRDELITAGQDRQLLSWTPSVDDARRRLWLAGTSAAPVSYTHLTLPTIA
eukprot:TRINITY_DN5617_c0_g1_i1.p2 TRINITY_DN5617_c0_g1~~TRINITY_DN5617_c0_g1_i1.p2  ORF type:complete len:431 (-),score=215.99 TRINITY_DN5617_c0_g1_i1:30-1322(-)